MRMPGMIVIRGRGELDPANPLHRLQLSIPWPEGAISATQEYQGGPWRFYTIADKLKARREKMKSRLKDKREYGVIRRVPLYVWVFWCPGVGGFAFRGWYTYVIGRGEIEAGVNTRFPSERLQRRVMELFPLVDMPMFEIDSRVFGRWQRAFIKRYQRGTRSGKPQGKAPVWAEVVGDDVKGLVSRAEWPNELKNSGGGHAYAKTDRRIAMAL